MRITGFDQQSYFSDRSPVQRNVRPMEDSGTKRADSPSVQNPSDLQNNKSKEAAGTDKKTSAQPDQEKRGSEEESKEITRLKKRDTEVRAHEQAHMAAGGQYVRGGAKFEFSVGPDGRQYAVGGEVSIDMSPVPNNPEATIQKMQIVKQAALAPAQPSPQDRRVASEAEKATGQARQEIMKKAIEKMKEAQSGGTSSSKGSIIDLIA